MSTPLEILVNDLDTEGGNDEAIGKLKKANELYVHVKKFVDSSFPDWSALEPVKTALAGIIVLILV